MVWFHGYTLLYIGQKDPKCSIGKRTDCNFQASRKLLKWFQVQIHWSLLFFPWYTDTLSEPTFWLVTKLLKMWVRPLCFLYLDVYLVQFPAYTICMYFGWWDGGSGPPSGNDGLALGCWGHGFGITQATGSTVAQWAWKNEIQGCWRGRIHAHVWISYADILRKCVFIYISYILDSFCSLGLYSCSLTHCQAGLGLILSRFEHPWIAHPSHYGS